MKNIQYILVLASFILGYSCTEESFETDILRPLVKLSNSDISAVGDMLQCPDDLFPITAEQFGDTTIFSNKVYYWGASDSSFISIDIWVAESSLYATTIFDRRKPYYAEVSKDSIDEYKDLTAIAGDRSYNNGMTFIRDNLIVKIKTSKKYKSSIPEIARDVDAKILNSGSFFALRQVKPIIEEFKLKENPVHKDSATVISISAIEPNDRAITYLMFFEDKSTKGISIEDSVLCFDSSIADSTKSEFGLTLIVVSEFGFCADSTIYIQIEK